MAHRLASLLPGLGALLVTVILVGVGTWYSQPSETDDSFPLDEALLLWEGGPSARTKLHSQLTRPEDQVLVVRALLDRADAADPDICALLTDTDSRAWCTSTLHRPHLYERKRPTVARRSRTGGGPVDAALLATVTLPTVEPSEEAPRCPQTTEAHACAATRAQKQARSGDTTAAAATCHHIEAGRWRDECVFTAAEAAHAAGGDAMVGRASRLCGDAGQFQSHCLSHIVTAAAARTPAADRTAGWAAVSPRADLLREAWQDTDPELGALLVDRFYAEALDQAYSRARRLTGAPLSALPPEAHRHVRAALVARLIEADPDSRRSVADWQDRATEALARTEPDATAPALPQTTVKAHKIQDLWSRETPGDEAVRATFWRGEARRMTTEDAEPDLLICILETIARFQDPPGQRIESFQSHSSPAVQRTALRLGQTVRTRAGPR